MKSKLPWVSGDFPVWAWPWEDYINFVPDERWGQVGAEMVALGFEVPDARVVKSDFVAWHQVLNNDAILDEVASFTEAEKLSSWQRIFDPAQLEGWTDGTSIQACVDRVLPSEVFLVRPFTIEPMKDED